MDFENSAQRMALLLEEARRQSRRRSHGDCLPPSHPPVHSYVFVPVASSSRVYGWLARVEKQSTEVFSDEDTQLASTLGELAGMAYENARLVAQLQTQTKELREHEERTAFAMSAARTGLSHRDLGSSWVELSPCLQSTCC